MPKLAPTVRALVRWVDSSTWASGLGNVFWMEPSGVLKYSLVGFPYWSSTQGLTLGILIMAVLRTGFFSWSLMA